LTIFGFKSFEWLVLCAVSAIVDVRDDMH